ncbi:MAG TPA: ATP-binding protein [Terriglobales bacterium]|nr:ATP-binding protein [Terriglobales bacterium]
MKTKPRWNERTRLMLTLELAIVLPAAALIVVAVLHLRTIQRDRAIEALLQRDFSEVLAISEKHINQKAFALADDVREDFPAPDETCEAKLDKILASHPYAAHVFIYDPQGGIRLRSQPRRLKEADFRAESEGLTKMFATWLKVDFEDFSKKLEAKQKKEKEKLQPYVSEYYWAPRGEKHLYQSIPMFLVRDEESGEKAIAGMVFDAEYLRDEFFPEALEAEMNRNVESGEKKAAVMIVHPKNESTPLATTAGWDGGTPETERNMEAAFPGLTLGMKLRGTTLKAMSEKFMHTSFLILGCLSLLMAGGVVLTYRNVSKEIALARLKSDFVSNVSHELRTPLSLIRLYAETLELGRLTDPRKYQEYYQIIRKESERLTALINNILDFSRIEAGRKEYEFRETDLRELVKNTLESYRYQIEQNGFIFEEKIEPVPPMRIDREAMARSLVNLVNNALKYSQDRKYIGVNLYRENGSVKLEVIDHGIGIPRTEQGKIFEKFYRVGDPLVHNTKGSGLGLSLVRHIVHAHGGEVSVDSAPGQGSKFTIALPVEPNGVQSASA